MDNKCNDKFYMKPVEICNIKSLSNLKIKNPDNSIYNFDELNIFNNDIKTTLTDLNFNFRNSNNDFTYKDNEVNKKNLCEKTNNIDEYYMNCVISTNNSLFTFKDGKCIIDPSINLPPELMKYEEDGEIIVKLDRSKLDDEEGNFKYYEINNNKYCEDRWYDWIVIPNYHLGNRILKDSGAYSKEDVKVCYNNCKAGELPYVNSTGKYLCVPKEIAYEGIYEKKLDYSPLSLINLIGNDKEKLTKLYENLFDWKLAKKDKYKRNLEVLKYIDKDWIISDAINEIKKVLNTIVTDNNVDLKDYSFDYRNLTYKHPYFKEDDLTTILGMDKNEILSNDIILIHTAYLAYNYKDFIHKVKNEISTFFNFNDETIKEGTRIDIQKNNNYIFNINKIFNELDINTEITIDLLKRKNMDVIKKKKQRLANILYKAINICYDNKTDFSKNLINRTIEAFARYNNKNNKYDINDIKYLNEIKNGFEIDYYKFKELNDFYNSFEIIKDVNNPIEVGNTYVYTSKPEFYKAFRNNYQDNFFFYTEEISEVINENICKVGQFIKDNKCVYCDEGCNDEDKCRTDNNCKTFCAIECDKKKENQKTKCGTIGDSNDKKPLKEETKEIKTPIEEETIFPDFSYIFKSAIKIFFILIGIYILYMIYIIFNETILTFLNIFSSFFVWIWNLSKNPIKKAEYYENIIQRKYNDVVRKTMKTTP